MTGAALARTEAGLTAAARGHPRLDRPGARPRRRRGRTRRALRRAGPGRRRARARGLRPARAAGRAGARGRHRRRRRRVLPRRRDRRARSRAGPGRAAVPVGPSRRLRRLRLAARRRPDPARAQDRRAARAAAAPRRGRARRHASRSCPAACWAGGTGCGWPSTTRAGPGCARTAATTSCRSPTARSSRPGSCRPCWSSGSRRATRSRWRSTPTGSGTCTPSGRAASGPAVVQRAAGREWHLSAGTFWQVHPRAGGRRWSTVVGEWAQAPAGGLAWDLYGGVGLFAAVLAEQVGPDGRGARWSSRPRRPSPTGAPRWPTCGQVRLDGGPRGARAGVAARAGRTSWWPTRRAAAWAARRSRPCATARPRGSCTSPATRPPWPATSPCSPRTATSWPPCARSTRSR